MNNKSKVKKKRIKSLEYKWILSSAFHVCAYTAKHSNGKKYIVYAHDFADMDTFLTRLEVFENGVATRIVDKETHFEQRRQLSYISDSNGAPKKKPFWYRGRIYEIIEEVDRL